MKSVSIFSGFIFLLVFYLSRVSSNAEGDALNSFKTNLADPYNVLLSWDPTLVNPCTWFHVTCNLENSVTRIDLGNANLTGRLVPQLGQLSNLQYLELYSNNLSGRVPGELGKLKALQSLDLYLNKLSGRIPPKLGKLSKLRYLRLNNNRLGGEIPMSLTNLQSLQVLDLSNNKLTGIIPVNGSFSRFTSISFANNSLTMPPPTSPSPAASPLLAPASSPSPFASLPALS